MFETSPVARQLKLLRERANLSMREVSEHLGWALTRYQHYEDRYRRQFLPLDFIRTIMPIFVAKGIQPSDMLALAGLSENEMPGRGSSGAEVQGLAAASPSGPSTTGAKRDLPVIGAVKGGSEGFYFNDGDAKEYVVRPGGLEGVANGFALYVDGDSMEPRYFAGEILYVNPNRPVTKNCFVAVELGDGQGLIKQFLRRSDDHIVLRQFNPAKDLRIAAKDVKRIYRIVGAGEAA